MSETNDKNDTPKIAPANAGALPPENSSERWAKYGANVILSSILVIALAGVVVWGAERFDKRADMTLSSSYSLKPQTLAVIENLRKPVKLVSLYAKLKPDQATPGAQDFAQPVADTLEEYRREGKNIEVEIIDPVAEPIKLDAWLNEVIQKYGGNIAGYRDFLTGFPDTLGKVKKFSAEQVKHIEGLKSAKFKNEEQVEIVNVTYGTLRGFPSLLAQIDAGIKEELQKKIPDYKGGVDNIRTGLDVFSRQLGKLAPALEQLAEDATAPQEARDYAKANIPQFKATKKIADDELAKIAGLGELKLDELRKKLVSDDDSGNFATRTIAVEGPNDIKLIGFKDVWTSGENSTMMANAGGPPRLRFAGERQLTAAILSLTEPKKKVAFVRGGGPPLASAAGQFGQGAAYSEIAERLRSYNFDVLERDLSGQWAMQAMQQQMPVSEASEEDIRDAVWVVFDEPPPSPELTKKLADHLAQPLYSGSDLSVDAGDSKRVTSASHKFGSGEVGQAIQVTGGGMPSTNPAEVAPAWGAGSYEIRSVDDGAAVLDRSAAPSKAVGGAWQIGKQSALVLVGLRGGDLADVLKDWGIKARPDFMAVHEAIDQPGAESSDFVEEARRHSPIFVLNELGDSAITTPLSSLDAAWIFAIPIETPGATDCTVRHILPIPLEPKSWGEKDFESAAQGKVPTFDPKNDLPAPIYGGAIAERKDKNGNVGRLVVIGSDRFAANGILEIPDPNIYKQSHLEVARFPANGELFTNSIFWLSHMDKMIALSPAALDTARIQPISPGMLSFWRYGVLLIGLPLLALFSGLMVWQKRRE